MLDSVRGSILIDYQYRVHARMNLLLIGLGEGLAVWSNSQSVWNNDRTNTHTYIAKQNLMIYSTYFNILLEARDECDLCRATGLCHCTCETRDVEVDAMLTGLQCDWGEEREGGGEGGSEGGRTDGERREDCSRATFSRACLASKIRRHY